jgi:hypothetical protein
MLKGPKENEDLVLSLGTGEIEAFVNFFGRIDTLRIRNMPTLFDALKALPGYIGTDA